MGPGRTGQKSTLGGEEVIRLTTPTTTEKALSQKIRRPEQTVLPGFAAQFDLFDGAAVAPETQTPALKRRVGQWGDLQEKGADKP